MGKRIEDWIGQYRHMDWAVLYMRLFAGGMMLFHNIGKMQDYNEIVNSYPSFASAGSAATPTCCPEPERRTCRKRIRCSGPQPGPPA